jgi:hypothetical protein
MKDRHLLLHYQASICSVSTKSMQHVNAVWSNDFINFTVLSNQIIQFTDCNLWAISIVFRKVLQATCRLHAASLTCLICFLQNKQSLWTWQSYTVQTMNLQLQLNLKTTTFPLTSLLLFTLAAVQNSFVVAHYRSNSFIYTRYTIAVCTSNGNYDAINLKYTLFFVTIYVIYSSCRWFLLAW